jgi:SAM-dependent methyltransferase
MNFTLPYTGERLVPEKADLSTFWEHVYRYRFARRFVSGKVVLDIACGEGYGTAAMEKAGAVKVIGVDIAAEACEHASRKYGIETRIGNAEAIPLDASSVDCVISFETIEHVANPGQFLNECKRVLKPRGTLIISTPNREAYHKLTPNNPYHCSELAHEDFAVMCSERFDKVEFYSQRPIWTCAWSPRRLAKSFGAASRPTARLARLLQSLLCPNLSPDATARYQLDPISAILSNPRAFSSIVDPYAIRTLVPRGIEEPIYTLAVAELL